MLYLHVSYHEKPEDEWEDILITNFSPFNKLYPKDGGKKGAYGIQQDIITPCGQSFLLTAYFSTADNLINYQFEKGGEMILSNSSYKKSLETFDPSVNLKLPNGGYLAISFSSLKEVESM